MHKHPDLPRLLQQALQQRDADPRWRRWLAPELSYGRHAGPARPDARMAAVAIVIYQQEDAWHVPLTVRPESLRSHAGQVSFPGGSVEPRETTQEAAHRELAEELYADTSVADVQIDWLGKLAPLHVFVTDMLVVPWVGVLKCAPQWRPQAAEVERVLPLSVETLLSDQQPTTMTIRRGELRFTAPRLVVEGCDVWGSTGVLLGELRGRLQRLQREEVAR